MGGNLRDLKRRIRSVQSTQQITRAMKLVAASKLRRAQESMERARPYAAGIRQLLASVAERAGTGSHPLFQRRRGPRTLLVVVTADRGLAGSFNANVIREARRFLERSADREVTLQLVGKKGRDFFRKRSHAIRRAQVDVFRRVDFETSRELATDLVKAFLEEGFDEILVLSNRFRTVMSQDLALERLLPLGAPSRDENEAAAPSVEYIYEPDAASILGELAPSSVETLVHQVLLESNASELGARMVAMENATKNAAEMIERLTLIMNRQRQASITTEIIEVVSGAAALG